jgi:hypothetical protein
MVNVTDVLSSELISTEAVGATTGSSCGSSCCGPLQDTVEKVAAMMSPIAIRIRFVINYRFLSLFIYNSHYSTKLR